jgi:hypothetical protein
LLEERCNILEKKLELEGTSLKQKTDSLLAAESDCSKLKIMLLEKDQEVCALTDDMNAKQRKAANELLTSKSEISMLKDRLESQLISNSQLEADYVDRNRILTEEKAELGRKLSTTEESLRACQRKLRDSDSSLQLVHLQNENSMLHEVLPKVD